MPQLYKTEAIVIRQMKYGESSLILDAYTLEKGLRSMIINGIRAKKSKSAIYQIMNQLDLVIYDSGPDKLNRIKETKIAYVYKSLGRDMIKTSIAIFMLDLFKQSVREHEANEPLYHFLKQSLILLDESSELLSVFPLNFVLSFSNHLGFYPQNNYSDLCCGFSMIDGAFVNKLSSNQYVLSQELSHHLSNLLCYIEDTKELFIPPKAIRKELLNKLIDFYKLQMDGFGDLKSLSIIESLFE